MKRRKIGPSETTPAAQPRFRNMIAVLKKPIVLLAIVMLLGIGVRVYKMHCVGVIGDEVWTYNDFCTDIHTAITNYKSSNNHILNSIMIIATQKLFGGYEHFLRIPAILFGTIFCISITYIVNKTIRSPALKIVILLLILLNWFIVDLTYLARGYAIALGVTFTGIAILIKLSSRAIDNAKLNWLLVLFIIAMNFVSLGAMLSSLSILVSVNIAWVVFIILSSIRFGKKAVIHAIVRVIVIISGSAASLWLLYRQVFPRMMRISRSFKVEPFYEYLRKILWEPFMYIDASWIKYNKLAYKASLTVLAGCVLICLCAFLFRLKTNSRRSLLSASPARIVIFLAAMIMLTMFVLSEVFRKSLGLPRNGVFLLPLVLVGSGIFMDRAADALSRIKTAPAVLRSVCVVLCGILCFLNLPSPRAVNVRPSDWGKQSSIGPLARKLRQINPDKDWKIKLTSPYLVALHRPMMYYNEFGYKVERVKGEYDLLMVPKHPTSSRIIYFEKEYFDDHHCSVIVNTLSFSEESIYYQMHY